MTTIAAAQVDEAQEPAARGARLSARRLLDRVLLAGAIATAAVLLGSFVISLVGIFTLRHPYVGWGDLVVADAKAVATGHFQYGNPVTQPLSNPYTPLYTWIFAGLLKVFWWEGWGPVVSMLAVVAALASLVWMLWSTITEWTERLAVASFAIALALGGLSAYDPNGVYEARPDQLAWCLLVVAGAITFRALVTNEGLSRRRLVGVGLLLTGSVFSKQTTFVPCLLLTVLTLAVPHRVDESPASRRRARLGWATAPLVFLGSSALLGIGLQIASRGYAYNLLVRDIFNYGRYIALGQELKWDFQRTVVTLVAFLIVLLVAAWMLLGDRERRRSRHAFVAVAAIVFAVSPIPTAVAAAMKIGGNFNQLSGPVWTLTLGSCVLLMLLRPSARQLTATGITCCILLVGLGLLPKRLVTDYIGKPRLDQRVKWVSMDPFLSAAVARGEAVYDFNVPSLSVSPKAPHYPAGDFVDRLNAGYTPRYFIQNLVDGRYALVAPMPQDSVNMNYWSAFGRYDASVAWKLNLLLSTAYDPTPNPTTGGLYFKPSPRLAKYRWFAECFGPWSADDAGVGVRIRGTGGLVCAERRGLHLSEAPAATTTLIATLREGSGDATIHFATGPTTLQLTPLNDGDQATAAPVSTALVQSCLAGSGTARSLTVRAVDRQGDWSCNTAGTGPVLEIPVGRGASAHVAIDLAAGDSPTMTASTSSGDAVPFVIANPDPS